MVLPFYRCDTDLAVGAFAATILQKLEHVLWLCPYTAQAHEECIAFMMSALCITRFNLVQLTIFKSNCTIRVHRPIGKPYVGSQGRQSH